MWFRRERGTKRNESSDFKETTPNTVRQVYMTCEARKAQWQGIFEGAPNADPAGMTFTEILGYDRHKCSRRYDRK